MSKKEDVQRLPAEQLFQEEIDALIKAEKNPIPTGWKMSPKSVLTYICGGKVDKKNQKSTIPLCQEWLDKLKSGVKVKEL